MVERHSDIAREQCEAESGEQDGESGMQRGGLTGNRGGRWSERGWQSTEQSWMRTGLPCLGFSMGLVQSPHRDSLEGASYVMLNFYINTLHLHIYS